MFDTRHPRSLSAALIPWAPNSAAPSTYWAQYAAMRTCSASVSGAAAPCISAKVPKRRSGVPGGSAAPASLVPPVGSAPGCGSVTFPKRSAAHLSTRPVASASSSESALATDAIASSSWVGLVFSVFICGRHAAKTCTYCMHTFSNVKQQHADITQARPPHGPEGARVHPRQWSSCQTWSRAQVFLSAKRPRWQVMARRPTTRSTGHKSRYAVFAPVTSSVSWQSKL